MAVGTKAYALRLGAEDPCALKADGAHLRLELKNGQFTQWEYCKNMPDEIGSQGTYTSTDKELTFRETCCGDTTIEWSSDGKGLTLKILRVQDGQPIGQEGRFILEHKWVKVH